MATDISKLLNETAAFIKLIESRKSQIDSVLENLDKNVSILREQLDVAAVSRKAVVPPNMLKKFPDVKQRLLSSLNTIIQEEIVEITRYVEQLSQFTEDLRKICERMEKLITQVKWKDHIHFYRSCSQIYQWSDKSWKYFHVICMNLRSGLKAVVMDSAHGSSNIKFRDSIDGVDQDYVFDSQIINMFQMLKADFSSRSKIVVR